MDKKLINQILFIGLAVSFVGLEAKSENQDIGTFKHIVPNEIRMLMSRNKCGQIEGFYLRNLWSSAFDYWIQEGTSLQYVAFACQSLEDSSSSEFKVVVLVRDLAVSNSFTEIEKCSSVIPFDLMPGGLEIRTIELVQSDNVNLWSNSREMKWEKKVISPKILNKSLVSLFISSDGQGAELFCLETNWHYVPYD